MLITFLCASYQFASHRHDLDDIVVVQDHEIVDITQVQLNKSKEGKLNKLKYRNNRFSIELEPQFIPSNQQSVILNHIKQLGANEIKIRLYWNKFMKQIDVYDFTGNNNIAQFIQQCYKMGFTINIAPGPYNNGQVDYGGIPFKFVESGGNLRVYSSNAFKQAYRSYLSALWVHLEQYNVSKCISSVQIDDEILSQTMQESIKRQNNESEIASNIFSGGNRLGFINLLSNSFRRFLPNLTQNAKDLPSHSANNTQYKINLEYILDLVDMWRQFNQSLNLYITESSLTVISFLHTVADEYMKVFLDTNLSIGLIRTDSSNDIQTVRDYLQQRNVSINIFVDGIGSYECATWGDRHLGEQPSNLYKLLYVFLKQGVDVNLRHFQAVAYYTYAGSYRTISGTNYFLPRGSCSYFIDIQANPTASFVKLQKVIQKVNKNNPQLQYNTTSEIISPLSSNQRINNLTNIFHKTVSSISSSTLLSVLNQGMNYGFTYDTMPQDFYSLEHYDIFKGMIAYFFDNSSFPQGQFTLQLRFSDIVHVLVGNDAAPKCSKVQTDAIEDLQCTINKNDSRNIIIVAISLGRDTTCQPLMKGIQNVNILLPNSQTNTLNKNSIIQPSQILFSDFKSIDLPYSGKIIGVSGPGFIQFIVNISQSEMYDIQYRNGLFFEVPEADVHYVVNDYELGFYFAKGPQNRVFCHAEYLQVGQNVIKLYAIDIQKVKSLHIYQSDWIYEQPTNNSEMAGAITIIVISILTIISILACKLIIVCMQKKYCH